MSDFGTNISLGNIEQILVAARTRIQENVEKAAEEAKRRTSEGKSLPYSGESTKMAQLGIINAANDML